jgi:hypothetical protein
MTFDQIIDAPLSFLPVQDIRAEGLGRGVILAPPTARSGSMPFSACTDPKFKRIVKLLSRGFLIVQSI